MTKPRYFWCEFFEVWLLLEDTGEHPYWAR